MVRLVFATSIEVYSASSIIFIFSYRAERDTEYQHSRKPWPLAAIPPMIKSLSLIVCIFSFSFCKGQNDSLEFSFDTIYSMHNSSLDCSVRFKIKSNFSRSIQVEDSLTTRDMFCLELSPARIEIQKLDSNCYETRSPDCDPIFGYFERRIPIKTIDPNEVLQYLLSITDYLHKRVNNFTERKVTAFLGNYRLRFHLNYRIGNNWKTVSSKWYYLNF